MTKKLKPTRDRWFGRNTLRTIVALEIIIGHVAVFLTAFFWMGIVLFKLNADTAQIILTVSPVLAATAASALRSILREKAPKGPGAEVASAYATIVIGFPLVLVGVLFALFVMAYQQVNGFNLDALKISLGVVEAFFGGYLGAIAESLFGPPPGDAKAEEEAKLKAEQEKQAQDAAAAKKKADDDARAAMEQEIRAKIAAEAKAAETPKAADQPAPAGDTPPTH